MFSTLPVLFDKRDDILIAAACRLADLGGRLHPDHRGTLTFEQVFRAPRAGQSHAERAFLATAIFARYTAIAEPPEQPSFHGAVFAIPGPAVGPRPWAPSDPAGLAACPATIRALLAESALTLQRTRLLC